MSPLAFISSKDTKIIQDIIDLYAGVSYVDAKRMIIKIFGSDLRSDHYTALGYLIGQVHTEQREQKTIKNILQCQRTN